MRRTRISRAPLCLGRKPEQKKIICIRFENVDRRFVSTCIVCVRDNKVSAPQMPENERAAQPMPKGEDDAFAHCDEMAFGHCFQCHLHTNRRIAQIFQKRIARTHTHTPPNKTVVLSVPGDSWHERERAYTMPTFAYNTKRASFAAKTKELRRQYLHFYEKKNYFCFFSAALSTDEFIIMANSARSERMKFNECESAEKNVPSENK